MPELPDDDATKNEAVDDVAREDHASGDTATEDDAPPRAFMFAALAIAVAAVAIFLGIAATRGTPSQPVAIAAVPAPAADGPQCRALVGSLPDELGDFRRAQAADPVPPGTAAWRAGASGDPVILRCGLDRPAEFVVGSPLQVVDGENGQSVQWFRMDDADAPRSTWVTVDRPVYVALTLPSGSGSGPIQTLSEVIARAMPAMPIRPGAVGDRPGG